MNGPSLVILAAGRARRYGGLKQLAPIGLNGEGVIDLLACDAYASGFEDIVIVVNPETGPEIQAHVEKNWPKYHRVQFAVQTELRGTVQAVLAAESALDLTKPFGVSNADDLYGRRAFKMLGEHLASDDNHCLVGFELDRALVGELPVSRGVCVVADGRLAKIVERRNVRRDGEGYVAEDGLEPARLDPRVTVSMNLWGFQPAIFSAMHECVARHDFEQEKEVQLSVMVGELLESHHTRFDVLATDSRCIGVTHASDLPLAQELVRLEIESGLRPECAFQPI
ncbi:MAG TPA: sugar phosphate nucleotidyltransferase [Acidimicrobiales bacterium]